jgi:hypothetical protein
MYGIQEPNIINLLDGDLIQEIGHTWTNGVGYTRFSKDGTEQYVHRYVMEKMIGRPLTKEEVVHHINHNKSDNRRENLQLCANDAEHFLIHAKEKYLAAGVHWTTHNWCSYHKQYETVDKFSTVNSTWTGYHNTCRAATNEYRKLKGLNVDKFDWRARLNQQYRRAMKQNTQISWLSKEGSCP